MKMGISFYNTDIYYVIIDKNNKLREHGILHNFNLGHTQQFIVLCQFYCVTTINIVEPIEKILNKKHTVSFNTFCGLIAFLNIRNISYNSICELDIYNFFRCSHSELPSIINSLYNNINGGRMEAIRWGECIASVYNEEDIINSTE